MRKAGVAVLIYAAFWFWAYAFGPMGFVLGGVAFVVGWAIGHHSGRRDGIEEVRKAWETPRHSLLGYTYYPPVRKGENN